MNIQNNAALLNPKGGQNATNNVTNDVENNSNNNFQQSNNNNSLLPPDAAVVEIDEHGCFLSISSILEDNGEKIWFQIIEEIGHGGMGVVYSVQACCDDIPILRDGSSRNGTSSTQNSHSPETSFALKIIRPQMRKWQRWELMKSWQEVEVYKKLGLQVGFQANSQETNIVRLIASGIHIQSQSIIMLMDLAEGDLSKLIKSEEFVGLLKPKIENPAGPGTDHPAGPGANNSADPGANNSAGPGANNSANPGANNSANPGANNSAGPGANNSANPGANNSADPGANNPGAGLRLILRLWRDVLRSVSYLHDNNVLHCDLKPANFLVFRNKSSQPEEGSTYPEQEALADVTIRLTDFGLSANIAISQTHFETPHGGGTFFYMAPELFFQSDRGVAGSLLIRKPVDIWACGVIGFRMLFGKLPFEAFAANPRRLPLACSNPNLRILFPMELARERGVCLSANDCPNESDRLFMQLCFLIQQCLLFDVSKRWIARDLLRCCNLLLDDKPLPADMVLGGHENQSLSHSMWKTCLNAETERANDPVYLKSRVNFTDQGTEMFSLAPAQFPPSVGNSANSANVMNQNVAKSRIPNANYTVSEYPDLLPLITEPAGGYCTNDDSNHQTSNHQTNFIHGETPDDVFNETEKKVSAIAAKSLNVNHPVGTQRNHEGDEDMRVASGFAPAFADRKEALEFSPKSQKEVRDDFDRPVVIEIDETTCLITPVAIKEEPEHEQENTIIHAEQFAEAPLNVIARLPAAATSTPAEFVAEESSESKLLVCKTFKKKHIAWIVPLIIVIAVAVSVGTWYLHKTRSGFTSHDSDQNSGRGNSTETDRNQGDVSQKITDRDLATPSRNISEQNLTNIFERQTTTDGGEHSQTNHSSHHENSEKDGTDSQQGDHEKQPQQRPSSLTAYLRDMMGKYSNTIKKCSLFSVLGLLGIAVPFGFLYNQNEKVNPWGGVTNINPTWLSDEPESKRGNRFTPLHLSGQAPTAVAKPNNEPEKLDEDSGPEFLVSTDDDPMYDSDSAERVYVSRRKESKKPASDSNSESSVSESSESQQASKLVEEFFSKLDTALREKLKQKTKESHTKTIGRMLIEFANENRDAMKTHQAVLRKGFETLRCFEQSQTSSQTPEKIQTSPQENVIPQEVSLLINPQDGTPFQGCHNSNHGKMTLLHVVAIESKNIESKDSQLNDSETLDLSFYILWILVRLLRMDPDVKDEEKNTALYYALDRSPINETNSAFASYLIAGGASDAASGLPILKGSITLREEGSITLREEGSITLREEVRDSWRERAAQHYWAFFQYYWNKLEVPAEISEEKQQTLQTPNFNHDMSIVNRVDCQILQALQYYFKSLRDQWKSDQMEETEPLPIQPLVYMEITLFDLVRRYIFSFIEPDSEGKPDLAEKMYDLMLETIKPSHDNSLRLEVETKERCVEIIAEAFEYIRSEELLPFSESV